MRPGAIWSKQTEKLVAQSSVFVPVMSPSYFKSDACRREFEFFESGAHPSRLLVFPVYFVMTGEVENVGAQSQSVWIQNLLRHKFLDLRRHRFDLTSRAARQVIVRLGTSIRDAHAQLSREKPTNLSTGLKQVSESAEPIYLDSLGLENFRCFSQLRLSFNRPSSLEGRWTCIAGINGSGKSSILQALGVALLGNPLALELGGERLNRMRRMGDRLGGNRAEIELGLRSAESNRHLRLHLAIDEGRVVSVGGPSFAPPSPAPSWDQIRQLVIAAYGATRNLSSRSDSAGENLSLDVRHQITLFDPLSQLAGAELLLARQLPAWPLLDLHGAGLTEFARPAHSTR